MRRLSLLAFSALCSSAALAAPETIRASQRIEAELTTEDSPRDDGGVSRDYRIQVEAGSFLIVSVSSEDFDGVLSVFNPDRTKAGENDDRSDGNLNPLVAVEAVESGLYTIRVSSLGNGESGLGKFSLRSVTAKE